MGGMLTEKGQLQNFTVSENYFIQSSDMAKLSGSDKRWMLLQAKMIPESKIINPMVDVNPKVEKKNLLSIPSKMTG